jgi:hypothetical protein
MPKSRKPVRRPAEFHDEMASFDADMEIDEALDREAASECELIRQWLKSRQGRVN